tara:strand:- start:493 stop:1422 length:930 start_codon:yes stop_codon:yes gene_type:complete
MDFNKIIQSLLLIILISISSCTRSNIHDSIEMNWRVLDIKIKNNILIYKGYNNDVPLRAWVALIPPEKNNIRILVSNENDGVSTPSKIASEFGASVVINGGYFKRGQSPIRHVGLLKSKDSLYEPASGYVYRENIKYNINRGALGIFYNNSLDISWASTKNDSIFIWSFPFENKPGNPASINYNFSEYWDVKEAVHAGPILIRNEKIKVTSEQEVFFNTPVDGVQPRSAIGYKKNGDIIMMVVDGRQVDSRGVYLKELAMLMKQFDCEEALNLDGGGSSSLVVNGKLINNPVGLKSERQVMSFVAIIPD